MKYAIVALGILLAACSKSTTVTANDDGGSVAMSIGEQVELVLPGNPSTGYDWHVASVDSAILRKDGEATFEPESDLVGAPGLVHLRFTAVGEGATTLALTYDRVFDDLPPEDTYELHVDVSN